MITLMFHDLAAGMDVPYPLLPSWKLSMLHWSEASTSTKIKDSLIISYSVCQGYRLPTGPSINDVTAFRGGYQGFCDNSTKGSRF